MLRPNPRNRVYFSHKLFKKENKIEAIEVNSLPHRDLFGAVSVYVSMFHETSISAFQFDFYSVLSHERFM